MRLPDGARGARLDRAVAEALRAEGREVSIQEVRRALQGGKIRVGGARRAPGDRALGGETISIEALVTRAEAQLRPAPELLPRIALLFEDASQLALAKPSGVPVMPLRHDEAGTLLGAAIALRPEIAAAGPPLEGGSVHRLDTQTSGVVLFARTSARRDELRAAFGSGAIEKRYQALVLDPSGACAPGLVIDAPLASRGERVRVVEPEDRGAMTARTEVVAVERLADRWAWVELAAHTGRRHQIRVHLASIGAPIASDPLYGPDAPPGLHRLALHASRLVLPEGPVIDAPLPEDLASVLEHLR